MQLCMLVLSYGPQETIPSIVTVSIFLQLTHAHKPHTVSDLQGLLHTKSEVRL